MRKIILYLLPLILTGCSFANYPIKWQRKGIYTGEKKEIINSGNTGKTIKALYTGSGGVVIDFGETAIMTDPYFSNNPFVNIMLGKIRTRPEYVQSGMKSLEDATINTSTITHVLIAHSHYDHLMDLPFLYQNYLSENLKICGSSSTFNAIKKFIDDSSFINIESAANSPSNPNNTELSWIQISEQLKVLPIQSSHAPHFLNIRLMEGVIKKEGIKNFERVTDKTRAKHWKTGKVFSFLIDYEQEDKTVYRIFIQSSSCAPPYGFPPVSVLEGKKVDLAFIGVASTQNVKDYPERLLKTLKPEKIVLIHWEDFFRPYTKPPKTVRFTNFNKFFNRVKKAYGIENLEDLNGKMIMPAPGTAFFINY